MSDKVDKYEGKESSKTDSKGKEPKTETKGKEPKTKTDVQGEESRTKTDVQGKEAPPKDTVKHRHSVSDGITHFPMHLISFIMRLVGGIVLLATGIFLFLAARYNGSMWVAAEGLKLDGKERGMMTTTTLLCNLAGCFCLFISLYLTWSGLILGSLMFAEKPWNPETWNSIRVEANKKL